MVLMFDTINFSYSTSLLGGSYLIDTDSYFLHQMNEYSFFKGEIHLSKDQGNRFPEDKRDEIFFAFLLASEYNLVLKFFHFCALLHWRSLHRRKIREVFWYFTILIHTWQSFAPQEISDKKERWRKVIFFTLLWIESLMQSRRDLSYLMGAVRM